MVQNVGSVEVVSVVSDEILEALNRLVVQLDKDAKEITDITAHSIIDNPNSSLFIWRDSDGTIHGMLMLSTFTIPSGVRAMLQNVVVDSTARGKGAGAAMVCAALDLAKSRGVLTVDLFVHADNEAASRLYERCGFELRDTNVYRYFCD